MGALSPLLLIGTGIICLGDLLHIIGLGTPNWVEATVFGIDINSGLFKYCRGDTCNDVEEPTSKLEAVQAMIILGMLCGLLAGAIALIYVIFSVMSKSTPKLMALICAGASAAAFTFIIIGIIVYAADVYDSDVADLGFSFALCIVGGIMLLVGGILFLLGAKSTD